MTSSGALFDLPRRPAGRHEKANEKAMRRARAAGLLGTDQEGTALLLRALARALDDAELEGRTSAVAGVAREYRATLQTAGMVASVADAPRDPFLELLGELEDAADADAHG